VVPLAVEAVKEQIPVRGFVVSHANTLRPCDDDAAQGRGSARPAPAREQPGVDGVVSKKAKRTAGTRPNAT
jgi:hypothetical protein